MPVTSLLRDGSFRLERYWLLIRPRVTPRSVAGDLWFTRVRGVPLTGSG